MRHIFAFKDDYVVYSGYADISRLDVEQRGKTIYLHIFSQTEYMGVVACDNYLID